MAKVERSENAAYREGLWIRSWLVLFLAIPVLLLSAMAAAQAFSGFPLGNSPIATWGFVSLAVLFLVVAIVFAHLTIDVDQKRIRLRLGLFRKEIPLDDVSGAVPDRPKARTYPGLGLRFGTDGSMAFITSFGEGVKVSRREGSPVVFSTHHATQVIQIIDSGVTRSHTWGITGRMQSD